jgi:hypothetical protein
VDVQTIDEQYRQLQAEAQQTSAKLQVLADKLQAAATSGDQNAREWQLDLKEIALAIQSEQNQMLLLLQALHGFIAAQQQSVQAYPQWGGQAGYAGQQGGLMGALSGFLNSRFGRAIEMGAGFGIGDDLINKIF